MRFWALATVATLSAFAVSAFAAALLARFAGGALARRAARMPAPRRARLLFAIRILPAAMAITSAFAIALPIFLWFEERDTVEPVSRTLAFAAAFGTCLLARGAWRAVAAWRATAAFVGAAERCGRRLDGLEARLPAYAIEDAFPTVAVAGIFRPRLFVSERVLREFPAPEIAAMVAHECAHVAARDNVKRLLMRASPDLFAHAGVERAWAAAAEEAADATAATMGASVRLDLARALVRVARLAAPSAPQLASAFYAGGSIDHRVRRLVDPPPAATSRRWPAAVLPIVFFAAVWAIVTAAPALHALMESAVRLLP